MREAPKTFVRPKKETYTISFIVTDAERDEIKKYITHNGELTHIMRGLVRKWIIEKRKELAAMPPSSTEIPGKEV